ncbi:MAG: hypothetical protein AAB641_00090 [Patescibacteria group bacterium]
MKKSLKKILGIIFVLVGALSILTPFTPVGFLFFVGLEFLGLRFLLWDKVKSWFKF